MKNPKTRRKAQYEAAVKFIRRGDTHNWNAKEICKQYAIGHGVWTKKIISELCDNPLLTDKQVAEEWRLIRFASPAIIAEAAEGNEEHNEFEDAVKAKPGEFSWPTPKYGIADEVIYRKSYDNHYCKGKITDIALRVTSNGKSISYRIDNTDGWFFEFKLFSNKDEVEASIREEHEFLIADELARLEIR